MLLFKKLNVRAFSHISKKQKCVSTRTFWISKNLQQSDFHIFSFFLLFLHLKNEWPKALGMLEFGDFRIYVTWDLLLQSSMIFALLEYHIFGCSKSHFFRIARVLQFKQKMCSKFTLNFFSMCLSNLWFK